MRLYIGKLYQTNNPDLRKRIIVDDVAYHSQNNVHTITYHLVPNTGDKFAMDYQLFRENYTEVKLEDLDKLEPKYTGV